MLGRDNSGVLRGWPGGVQPCQAFHQSLKKASPESCAPGCRCPGIPGWLGGKRPKVFLEKWRGPKKPRPKKWRMIQWLTKAFFLLLGGTYLVGEIEFRLLFIGTLAR